MTSSRPRPQSQAPPSMTQSCHSATQLTANIGAAQLTNYSLLFQQQSKQSEEVYTLKFELRQTQSELDKQHALHQQDTMQLKNRITDILEQKQKSQEINDMLISSLRAAIQNQPHSKAYLVEFDYVCDMVRMFTNQQNRRQSSFIQQNSVAGAETSLEEIQAEPISLKSSQTQTSGESWPSTNLTYTPKEKELLDKLQQLEKVARDSKTATQKSHGQKTELATKMRELMATTEEAQSKITALESEKEELSSLVEFMKNAGQSHEQQLVADSNAKEMELRKMCETLQLKYQKKKKSAKERKHALKSEVVGLKRQLSDALHQACSYSDQLNQIKQGQSIEVLRQPPQDSIEINNQLQTKGVKRHQRAPSALTQEEVLTARVTNVRRLELDQENLQSTAENGRADSQKLPKQMQCHVSQFPAGVLQFQQQDSCEDPSNLPSSRSQQQQRAKANPTKDIKSVYMTAAQNRDLQDPTKSGRSSGDGRSETENYGAVDNELKQREQKVVLRDDQVTRVVGNTAAFHSVEYSKGLSGNNPPFSERAINTEQQAMPRGHQLKSHAKLFSKFVNINKDNQQQQQPLNASKLSHFISPRSTKPIQEDTDQAPKHNDCQDINGESSNTLNLMDSSIADNECVNQEQSSQRPLIKAQGQTEKVTDSWMQINDVTQLQQLEPYRDNEYTTDGDQSLIFRDSLDASQSRMQAPHNSAAMYHHQKQLTSMTQQTQLTHVEGVCQPYKIQMEDSTDQLVRIEASPSRLTTQNDHSSERKKSMRKRQLSSKRKSKPRIQVSPVKSQQGSSPVNMNKNKHRSPCCNDEITLQNAQKSLQMINQQPATLTLAPLAQATNDPRKNHSTKGQSQLRQFQKHHQRGQRQNVHNHQNQMLVQEEQRQLSETKSCCSIEHHNLSSSSIEGMIKFGLPGQNQTKAGAVQNAKKQKAGGRMKYRSPDQTHNYTQLNRSKSPNGIERDQINEIIDEITCQLQAAEKLNQRRSLGLSEDNDHGADQGVFTREEMGGLGNNKYGSVCHTERVAEIDPRHLSQRHIHQPQRQYNNQAKQQQYLTRDALVETMTSHRSCCQNAISCNTSSHGGNCTHYHNHYEQAKHSGEATIGIGGPSERLISQCFEKIGQSLDQLAAKDRIIQQLINDNHASSQKKTDLRKNLKLLRQTLQQCSPRGHGTQAHLLHQENQNLSFENEHLRDKVEKTQNLLRMYHLDSPLKKEQGLKSRSSSQYDLEQLRKMALISFQQRKSPSKYNTKLQQANNQSSDQMTQPRFDLSGHRAHEGSLRVPPLTERGQVAQNQPRFIDSALYPNDKQTSQALNKKRQQLFKSMVNASSNEGQRQSFQPKNVPQTVRSAERHQQNHRDALVKGESTMRQHDKVKKIVSSGSVVSKFSTTQKLGSLTTRYAPQHQQTQMLVDEQDTLCESNDTTSKNNSKFLRASQWNKTTVAVAQALKNVQSSVDKSSDQQFQRTLQYSQDFVARQKQAVPKQCRDGFLKVSSHHMANKQLKLGQMEQPQHIMHEQVKSPRQRYNDADDEDCFVEEMRSSLPSCIEEFSGAQEQTQHLGGPQTETGGENDIGDYALPGGVMADRNKMEMNDNNLNQMHGRQNMVQSFNKMLVLQNQTETLGMIAQSYQSENDSRVLYDHSNTASKFRGLQHPKKYVVKEQSPTIGEDSDKTQPDDFFLAHSQFKEDDSSQISDQQMMAQVSPRNYYYNNH